MSIGKGPDAPNLFTLVGVPIQSYGVSKSTARYGVLSAPIGVLLFFFVTALAVRVGAELNAEIDKMWPTTSTAEGRQRSHRSEPPTPG